MSINAAINSAMSGLNAVSRATGLVSENIANAMTPGYGRRTLGLAAQTVTGPGVRVTEIRRQADPVLIANRRSAEAGFGAADARAGFFDRMSLLVGEPGDVGSYSDLLNRFESSLISVASRPDSPQRLDDAVSQASAMARALNSAADGLRDMRSQADRTIGTMVEQLNTSLQRLQDLNVAITATDVAGSDISALQDQRQMVIDGINEMVPVTVVDRPRGQVAIYSEGGAILLDGQPATIGFTSVNMTAPGMTLDNGALSGLTINGYEVRTDSANGALRGGTLGAQFAIRDELSVEVQASLDAVARDLIERFEAPGLDPTRTPGSPGLFTDAGAALDPTEEVGLANRIAVNAAVDPTQGGESWRLRDGLEATTPGQPGDAGLLPALGDALTTARALSSGSFGIAAMSATDVASRLISQIGLSQSSSQDALAYASVSLTELSRAELSQGVDTDAELQNLLILEQAYAANARVLEVANGMLDSLLGV